mmetsp:Transcript_10764/g.34144  ORF Transcript_10764/g.34144 Transcript_10764/m.34144 type:complete len:293 (-) Transcript_10764:35-913(-)
MADFRGLGREGETLARLGLKVARYLGAHLYLSLLTGATMVAAEAAARGADSTLAHAPSAADSTLAHAAVRWRNAVLSRYASFKSSLLTLYAQVSSLAPPPAAHPGSSAPSTPTPHDDPTHDSSFALTSVNAHFSPLLQESIMHLISSASNSRRRLLVGVLDHARSLGYNGQVKVWEVVLAGERGGVHGWETAEPDSLSVAEAERLFEAEQEERLGTFELWALSWLREQTSAFLARELFAPSLPLLHEKLHQQVAEISGGFRALLQEGVNVSLGEFDAKLDILLGEVERVDGN